MLRSKRFDDLNLMAFIYNFLNKYKLYPTAITILAITVHMHSYKTANTRIMNIIIIINELHPARLHDASTLWLSLRD